MVNGESSDSRKSSLLVTFLLIKSKTVHKTFDRSNLTLKCFSAVTPVPTSVTTAIDQTITCTISELTVTPDTYPATVTWKSPEGVIISSDNEDYTLNPGTPSSFGVQSAKLTIKPGVLKELEPRSVFQCSVRSGEYPQSPDSPFFDVDVTVRFVLGW